MEAAGLLRDSAGGHSARRSRSTPRPAAGAAGFTRARAPAL